MKRGICAVFAAIERSLMGAFHAARAAGLNPAFGGLGAKLMRTQANRRLRPATAKLAMHRHGQGNRSVGKLGTRKWSGRVYLLKGIRP